MICLMMIKHFLGYRINNRLVTKVLIWTYLQRVEDVN